MSILFLYYPVPLKFMGEIIKAKSLHENIYWGLPLIFVGYVFKQFHNIMHPSDKRIYKWEGYKFLEITMLVATIYCVISALCVILSVLLKDKLSAANIGLMYFSGAGVSFVTSGTVFLAHNSLKKILNSIEDK